MRVGKISSEDLKPIVLRMAQNQIALGGSVVKTEPIELSIFGNKGGKYHTRVSQIIDEAGFPRTKYVRKNALNAVQNESKGNIKVLCCGPHCIQVDPQGVREVQP